MVYNKSFEFFVPFFSLFYFKVHLKTITSEHMASEESPKILEHCRPYLYNNIPSDSWLTTAMEEMPYKDTTQQLYCKFCFFMKYCKFANNFRLNKTKNKGRI